MTYHKRPVVTRKCAHCRTKFEAAHKSRLYCCQSCNTLAWRARQPKDSASAKSSAATEPSSNSLALTAQNVGVVALGTLAAQGTTALLQHLLPAESPQGLLLAELRQLRQDLGLAPAAASLPAGMESPSTFLPPALAVATTPLVSLPTGQGPPLAFVRLSYHGHVLYHHPGQQLLLWVYAPGRYRRIVAATGLAHLAAHPAQPSGAQLTPAADAVPAAPADEEAQVAAMTAAFMQVLTDEEAQEQEQAVAATAAFAQALAELALVPAAAVQSPLAGPPSEHEQSPH